MEASIFNKHTPSVYNGVGKCIVALCCKCSLDNDMDGFIYFDAKNRLMPYYRRLSAYNIGGLRMVINEQQARRLIEKYF